MAVTKATFTSDVGTAFVVSGEDFPDALAAGPVGAHRWPVLLTKRDSLPVVVAAELTRLDPGMVIVVGGSGVITDVTVDQIKAASGAEEVRRLAGGDRYATAVKVAEILEEFQTVYIASGESFADAVAAGPAAGKESAPLLLTRATTLPAVTRDYLKGKELKKIVLVGGTAAISAQVEMSVRALVPSASLVRHGGRDRYDTARLVALSLWPSSAETVFYAPGANFPDALAATPAAIVNDAPLLLTAPSCNPYETTVATGQLRPSGPEAPALRQVAVGGEGVTYAGAVICGPKPAYLPFPEGLGCKEFPSQAAAQAWFTYWYPRVGDVFLLDRDNDRKVCEVWPPR